ncbi:CBO0543 family protein [Bacillaceae bacterium IKA-2]|nr:CBO0543 family protein [Bacillaceae bacterium IKA-2]
MQITFEVYNIINHPLPEKEWNTIIESREYMWTLLLDYWKTHTLFSFNWWFLFVTTIGFLILWLWLLDKSRVIEIITFGLLLTTIVCILDLIGITLVLWSYPDRLAPFLTPIFEVHRIHMPILYMLIYQYFKPWKSFILVITFASFIFAFVLEPITVWLGVYIIHNWRYMYSFPIYILLGITFKYLMIKFKHIELKYKH